jgi:hypothetical protein
MAQLRIVPYNHHDDATLTEVGTSLADFGPTNTQNTLRGRVLRTSSGAGYTLRGTLAATKSATCLALFRHTAWGGDIQVELFSDAAWTTSVYDSTALPAECFTPDANFDFGFPGGDPFTKEGAYVHWFAEESFRSYEITFSGTPTAGFWEVCRVYLGKAFEFAINPDYGAPLGYEDNTDSNRTLGGSQRTNHGEQWRTLQLELNSLRETEREPLLRMVRRLGKGRDFVISLFPEDGTTMEEAYTINAKLSAINPIVRQISRLQNRLSMQEQ